MIVAKFGGSSLATAEQFRKVIAIIQSDPDRRVVVVSAPGKRTKSKREKKITDLLIEVARHFAAMGEPGAALAQVIKRYEDIRRGLKLDPAITATIAADLEARLEARYADDSLREESLKAAGEDNNARLMAAALTASGVPAEYVSPLDAGLVLTGEPGNALVCAEAYANLRKLRNRKRVVVFPGFFGYRQERRGGQERKIILTFPRGGSDITGSIVARAIKADLYENWTDVDYVAAADPKIVQDPCPIVELTYREMRELAYTGFSVFNDEALAPVQEVGIPVRICNTNNPPAPGTRIVAQRDSSPNVVVGVAAAKPFCTLIVSKYLLNREKGIGRRLLEVIEEAGLSWEHLPTGIDDISVIMREDSFPPSLQREIVPRIRERLGTRDVKVERGMALVMIVGEGMKHTHGVTSRASAALAREQINIEMINQGSSEISVVFGVCQSRMQDAVRALYREFFTKACPK
jgi:aspartate kinase